MAASKTSPPVFGGFSDADVRAEVEKFQTSSLPPQVNRAYHYFTDAIGTRFPHHITAMKASIRHMNTIR